MTSKHELMPLFTGIRKNEKNLNLRLFLKQTKKVGNKRQCSYGQQVSFQYGFDKFEINLETNKFKLFL